MRHAEPAERYDRRALRSGALILGGDKHALGIARSLGRRDIPVRVVGDPGPLLGAVSRYVSRAYRWPGPEEADRLELLARLAGRESLDGWTLFVTEDRTAGFAARHHSVLSEWFRMTVPPYEIAGLALDKRRTYALAESAGVDTPWTRHGPLPAKTPLPCVIKPSGRDVENALTRDRAWRADTRQQLEHLHGRAVSLMPSDEVLVQELVPGGGEAQFSFAGVFVDGVPVGSVVARRLRQYPVDFGHSSSFVETSDDRDVEELGARLIAAMCYSGLAEVEFKRDRRDGRLKLLDVNPRVWTWNALAARAGVDVPYLAWRVARGEPVVRLRARAGVRWVRMATDIPASIQGMRRGTTSISEYARTFRPPVQFAVFAISDPLPALADLPYATWRSRMAPKEA